MPVLTSLEFKFVKQQSSEVADSAVIRVGSLILFEHPQLASRFRRSAACISLPATLYRAISSLCLFEDVFFLGMLCCRVLCWRCAIWSSCWCPAFWKFTEQERIYNEFMSLPVIIRARLLHLTVRTHRLRYAIYHHRRYGKTRVQLIEGAPEIAQEVSLDVLIWATHLDYAALQVMFSDRSRHPSFTWFGSYPPGLTLEPRTNIPRLLNPYH